MYRAVRAFRMERFRAATVYRPDRFKHVVVATDKTFVSSRAKDPYSSNLYSSPMTQFDSAIARWCRLRNAPAEGSRGAPWRNTPSLATI